MVNKRQQAGQALIEAIFGVVILALTVTGVVSLMVSSVGQKSKVTDRKTANRLGEKVIENLMVQKNVGPSAFWLLNPVTNATDADFPGYRYSVGFSVVGYPNCNVGMTDCAEAIINVGWSGSRGDENINFSKFFSRR